MLSESSSAFHLSGSRLHNSDDQDGQFFQSGQFNAAEKYERSHWVPIGWTRILELVQTVQVDGAWASQQFGTADDEDDFTVADLAAPYWERPSGPIWWCNVAAGHPNIEVWLRNAQWLHPAISVALRDESRLISERMKHLLYEELLSVGGYDMPRTVHEVIARLACHLSQWDDRLFRKTIFGAADEIELKFMNRRNHEDINLLSIILNQEIRRLSRQVIRVKWSLHAREEIVFELLQHVRGNVARNVLEGIRKRTRNMIEEQEAVRGRLFTIQDVMLSSVRAWLQDRSLRVTHNLGVFGGVGVVLTVITGLFGINVDGIPGAANTPYAFGVFTVITFFIGGVLIALGLSYLGLRKPIAEEQVEVRKLELQELVRMFQHEAETHAKVRESVQRSNLPPTAGDTFGQDADYFLIQ
ncbi:uncharacterized protein LOC114742670 isoform X2 [Neltuma alba]|uniref:uncharacterized protein LOC114742670 isoform X2 n=1 Tax=Neltuma alba TaxID=207710 RepID=UPI0010A4650C|nr:uncharacterized protein LOC114742670 isoform X2 [Prosopis alba]